VCFVVVNRGEVVVDCVVNRGELSGVFRVEKHATFPDLFLRVSYFGNTVCVSSPSQFMREDSTD
jgi:hypothetical protein